MKKNSKKPAAPSRDLYQAVTDRIVAALEAGTKPWALENMGRRRAAAPEQRRRISRDQSALAHAHRWRRVTARPIG
jgi:antirestriction protein ArdC